MRRTLAASLICLFLLPVAADAQRRRRSTRKSSKPAATEKKDTGEIRLSAKRVADQIKTLTHFLYLLGGVAKGIEATDAAIQRGEANAATAQQNERNKATVLESMRNVQAGLAELESDFGNNPALRPYYRNILGITIDAQTAERQAASGQFDQSGRTLLKVVDKLTETLFSLHATE